MPYTVFYTYSDDRTATEYSRVLTTESGMNMFCRLSPLVGRIVTRITKPEEI